MVNKHHIGQALCGLLKYSTQGHGAATKSGLCGYAEISTANCPQACNNIASALPSRVIFSSNAQAYDGSQAGYWTEQQSEEEPACFVDPESAHDVAQILTIAKEARCPFAVKGGGHTSFAGASSINGGISIDMRKMNVVTPNENGTVVSVGPGSRWKQVYDAIEPLNITVVGGRVASVGVAGLTTGGGLSFFTGLHGFACDNVQNYEVVTADGRIRNANETSNPNLYFALRGGSGNFGIVTRFDFDAYPSGDSVIGGNLNFNQTQAVAATDAYYEFCDTINHVPEATTWLAFSYIPALGQHILNMLPFYANSTDPSGAAAVYKNFTSLPTLSNDIKVTTQSALTQANSQPAGYRNTWWAFSFRPDRELMQETVQRFLEWDKTRYNGTFSMVYTVVSKPALARMSRRGGNPLGLSESDGPLIIVLMSPQWSDPAQDEEVIGMTRDFVDETVARSKAKGVDNPYIYLNYADVRQDVLAGYGEGNLARLRAISAEYDPERVFQQLAPGGHKLF
ncbi:uncharacterized protein MYCGRDRAFT_104786 [Zymoseptoria tritici IPO323]|uniref:FAD-binding PCMH-type domain-containing protein n=1 Tax=Zymoseptoria tritici (strain CBS 115943 / IPO323) TaxID=336722 RepID=F9XCZ7_ZYMTI|nr:uncharacterized protein MYCGRDRAFT_104786 [Zymoseptoria tritici IPO323]EGP86399.1 hypothetical protein MYCGRDRAFT_104786 [Zymoseptoria tritici IPO323]